MKPRNKSHVMFFFQFFERFQPFPAHSLFAFMVNVIKYGQRNFNLVLQFVRVALEISVTQKLFPFSMLAILQPRQKP